jgi:integrase
MPLIAVEPFHVYQYVDRRSAKTAAVREIEVLRHSLTKAVEWGLLKRNPLLGQLQLRGRKPRPRDRYIEDWEVVEALALPSRRKRGSVLMIQAYIRIKLVTALRRADLLRLRETDLLPDGIHVQPRKTALTTGKRIVILWSPELRQAIDAARAARPRDKSPLLFCDRRGDCYIKQDGTANGWDSMWQRFMQRLLAETKIATRFTEHDLRAKCASDAETLEHARRLLAHADEKTTSRYYRRRPEQVKPLR